MKIALVTYRADSARGGAERYTVDLAAALIERGHEVSIVATDEPSLPEGIGLVHLPPQGAGRTGKYRSFLRALDHHLSTQSYDIVHAMLPVYQCDIYHPHAGLAAESVQFGFQRQRTVLRRWLSRIGNRMNRKRRHFAEVERTLLSGDNPPVVLCLSNYIKAEVRRHYSMDESKLVRLFNAVNLDRFDPSSEDRGKLVRERLGIALDAVVALCMAQDFARKGVATAIRAVAQLGDSRLVLLVVGRDNAAPYRRLARQLEVDSQVIFAGATDDPVSFYQAGDFFVLPTRHDPCSLVVLEALAMGLPVISTRFNGACEIMVDGQHGFVMNDAEDVAALAGAMGELCDANRRQAMHQQVVKLRPQLSYTHHLDQLIGLYQQLAGTASVRS